MSWQDEVDELRRREELAKQMGGDERIQRQHDNGRLTVRERIDVLADDNSFHEIGALAGKARYSEDGELESFTPSNFVLGTARINGRRVVIGGDDFTVRGGAADAKVGKFTGLALDAQTKYADKDVAVASASVALETKKAPEPKKEPAAKKEPEAKKP